MTRMTGPTMTKDRFDPTQCAHQMRDQRRAFGYEYRRADYASESMRPLWEHSAPWATGTMVPLATNMREAIARDLAPRMPGHE